MPTNWKTMPFCPGCGEQHWLGWWTGLCSWCERLLINAELRKAGYL